ncbi:hypothetical protein [Beihai mantis shrimp virus 2]|uniref:hypothetical protein n=1 Tax=Beihai mantis shrimp virus 2 TaxID=1922429 RepID=UPI00090A1871|nr:hypothetical protein [Beihai mantis shrimp virus 2]APG77578.1 hypothetical protein [Beihai mantis shrimp virus 2]
MDVIHTHSAKPVRAVTFNNSQATPVRVLNMPDITTLQSEIDYLKRQILALQGDFSQISSINEILAQGLATQKAFLQRLSNLAATARNNSFTNTNQINQASAIPPGDSTLGKPSAISLVYFLLHSMGSSDIKLSSTEIKNFLSQDLNLCKFTNEIFSFGPEITPKAIEFTVPEPTLEEIYLVSIEPGKDDQSVVLYKFNIISNTWETEVLGTCAIDFSNFSVTNTQGILQCAYGQFVATSTSNVDLYSQNALLNYTFVRALESYTLLLEELIESALSSVSQTKLNPIVEEALRIEWLLLQFQESLLSMQANGIFYVESTSDYVSEINFSDVTKPLSTVSCQSSINYSVTPEGYVGSVSAEPAFEPEQQEGYSDIKNLDDFLLTVTTHSELEFHEYIVHEDHDVLEDYRKMTVSQEKPNLHHYVDIKISGSSFPGMEVDVQPCTVDRDGDISQVSFDTTYNADGSYQAVASVWVGARGLFYKYEVDGKTSQSGRYKENKVLSENEQVEIVTTASLEGDKIDCAQKIHGYALEFNSFNSVVKISGFKVRYPKPPVFSFVPSFDKQQTELMAITFKNTYESIKLTAEYEQLSARLEALGKICSPTLLGAFGGLFGTASNFAKSVKAACTLQKLASGFYGLEELVQGRYIGAILGFAGASTASLTNKLVRKGSFENKDDLIGHVAKTIRFSKYLPELNKRKKNYSNSPFETMSTSDNFIAKMGAPINQLPGSEFITNAFLNVTPEDKSYKRIMKIKEDGYFPEHQSIFTNTMFTVGPDVDTEELFVMQCRYGISDGAVNRIHSFNTGGSSAKTVAGPGSSFLIKKDGETSVPYLINGKIEKMALLAMDGYDPSLFTEEMSDTDLESIDNRTNMEIALSIDKKMKFYNSRVIESSPFQSTPEANRDALASLMSGSLFKDFNYSIPNRTCQPFADALYNNMLKSEQAPILGGFDFNSRHRLTLEPMSYADLDDLMLQTYRGILSFDIFVINNI